MQNTKLWNACKIGENLDGLEFGNDFLDTTSKVWEPGEK